MAVRNYPHGEVCRYYVGQPDLLVQSLPHYHLVEKDPAKHVEWRLDVYQRAAGNKELQKALWDACAADALFFINLMCWIIEPREGELDDENASKLIPFNSWCNQDPVIAAIAHYWGKRHVVGDKSRAQGASWIMVCLLVWAFIFKPNSFLGIGSKDEESADDPADPGSLGWKIDFIISMLPIWMRPSSYQCRKESWRDRKASTSTWTNPDNNSFIKALAATKGIGRGGRYTVFFLDESAFFPAGSDREAVANLVRTTNGLVMISTPHGMDNEHYDRVHKPGPWLKVILDWKDNPQQSRGLYVSKNGRVQHLDKTYNWAEQHPEGYHIVHDGRVRSPWYDNECAIHNNDMLFIAQELDREYSGSKGRPFPQAALDRFSDLVKRPVHTGMIEFDEVYPWDLDEIKWIEAEGYKFDLWEPLQGGYLPVARYVVGCDLSQGVGGELSSNSVLEIFNLDTRTQVGELAINTIDPVGFAGLSVAVCHWLGRGEASPLLIWEADGPGYIYGKEIKRLQYHNVWYPVMGHDLQRYAQRAKTAGYNNKDREKALSHLRGGIVNQTVTIRSSALLEECGHYVFGDDGKPMHPRTKTARDGSAKGASHGDRAIAASMAICAMDDRIKSAKRQKNRREQVAPEVFHPDSIAGRMARRDAQIRAASLNSCRW